MAEPFLLGTSLHHSGYFSHTTLILFTQLLTFIEQKATSLHKYDNIPTGHTAGLYVPHREPIAETGVILKVVCSMLVPMLRTSLYVTQLTCMFL
jgi:hypothetical protein